MPQIKSAIKRVRQNEKRRKHNKSRRSHMRTLIRKALNAEEADEAKELQRQAESYMDKMTSKGLVHKNKVARKKAQIDRHVKSLQSEKTEAEAAEKTDEEQEES